MHLIHDLRIVLMVMATCLDALRNRTDAPPLQELRMVGQLLATGRAIVDELLVSSELRSPMTHVDVNCLLDEVDDLVRVILGPRVRVHRALAATESRVLARRVDLERIVLNLVLMRLPPCPRAGC